MSGTKSNFDEVKVKYWRSQCDQEIESVESTVKEVYKILGTYPEQDDIVMKGIQKVGQKAQEEWSKLVSDLKKSNKEIDGAIDKLVKAGVDCVDAAAELLNKIIYK